MAGDDIPDGRIDQIVQNFLSSLFRPQLHKKLQRVDNSPSRPDIDIDSLLVSSLHAFRVAIPGEQPFLQVVDFLNKGDLEVQAGFLNRSHRFAELRDHGQFSLFNRVRAGVQTGTANREHRNDNGKRPNLDHGTSFPAGVSAP